MQRLHRTPRHGVGIDVGARAVHSVRIAGGLVVGVATSPAADLAAITAFCRGTDDVGVDAPAEASAGAHQYDDTVAPKFRTARCCEVAGRPAVPWVTPMAGVPVPGWMAVGFDVWAGLRSDGHDPMEVFPAGCFYRMNGGRWPARKTTVSGRRRRLDLLAEYLALPPGADAWSHDVIDATVAALVAYQGRAAAVAAPHDCPHPDGSQMWFPR